MEYFESTEGQFLYGAYRYLFAAQCLRDSVHWQNRGSGDLQTPTLNLLCHGLELLLKVTPIRRGMGESAIKHKFGHNLLRLWNTPVNFKLRQEIYEVSRRVWNEASASGEWPHDDFSEDPVTIIDLAIEKLSSLHGPDMNFALRYAIPPETWAPRPKFLLDTFVNIAETRLKNPILLD